MTHKTWILTDVSDSKWVESLNLSSRDLGLPDGIRWAVTKRTLRGGLQDGVDVVEVDNGDLRLTVLPTRGMGIWKGSYRGLPLGWDAPVRGPVHPRYVNLADREGLGWLQGFDEWIVRCGLQSMGPPGVDRWTGPDGQPRSAPLTLHGRIANLPASFLAITAETQAPYRISVTGQVDESMLFCPRLVLRSTVTTWPGSNRLLIEDQVTNTGGQPSEMQLLYHCNFGPPLLGEGAGFRAPIARVRPRDAYPEQIVRDFQSYGKPEAGRQEEVFFIELLGTAAEKKSLAVLHDARQEKAVGLRFRLSELPFFTLWKNTASERDGYVTGLEPGTSFPNFRSVEREQGRLRVIQPGETAVFTLEVEICDQRAGVSALLDEIRGLQGEQEYQA
ncbi:MAG: DUF4432 family protein [Acidobacteria bacterium]|nr:MAG: DUF4432 family protein [Acidobacteriota bacterium]